MSRNVVVVSWSDAGLDYQALAELRKSTDIRLYQAGVFKRELDGRLVSGQPLGAQHLAAMTRLVES
ncbi:hypothetical protein [Stenotrophomonas sp. NPDC077659]|uniref:hypothetical protein n=1 Tax=Stenotrophomonas sp. NPDC077659 TaxID=3390694 RepID=UPI003D043CD4